jgi:hypothetical protein
MSLSGPGGGDLLSMCVGTTSPEGPERTTTEESGLPPQS